MSTKELPVITIDGPSGVGKGTVAQILAEKLQWHMLDSGALYRVLALAASQHAVEFDNEPALEVLARHLDVQFESTDGGLPCKVILEGNNVTDQIRSEECGLWASKVSVYPTVRTALLERQRSFLRAPGLVTDGRDMGTVIFPQAQLKFFLTASSEERAKRRYKQLKEKGVSVNLGTILDEIQLRDERDKNRTVSPLVPAEDAVVIDTTELSVEQVMNIVVGYL